MYIPHFKIHPLGNELLGSFYFLAIIKIMSAMNISVQVFVWTHGFTSLGHILRSTIARSFCNFMFDILRNY